MGGNRTLSVALKFEGKDVTEYYLVLYKTLNGQYLVEDYFGDPNISYEAGTGVDAREGGGAESEAGAIRAYDTEDSLFSCLPNPLTDFELYIMKQIILASGQRALQGDKTLAENGQMRLNIVSEQDLEDGTNELRERANDELDRVAESGYYVTDLTWNVKEYDKAKHLYRYQVNVELTNVESLEEMIAVFECYRIGNRFLYMDGLKKVYR